MCIIKDSQTEIRFCLTTTLTPRQFIAGLTDFGPGRTTLFSNSAEEYLKVHHLGPSEADVTEGSSGIWERLYYDWSDPTRVVLTTTDSNIWEGTSGHTYAFTPRSDGKTDIAVAIVREGKDFKGQVLGFILRTIGKRVLECAFRNSIRAIEARHRIQIEKLEIENAVPSKPVRIS